MPAPIALARQELGACYLSRSWLPGLLVQLTSQQKLLLKALAAGQQAQAPQRERPSRRGLPMPGQRLGHLHQCLHTHNSRALPHLTDTCLRHSLHSMPHVHPV